MGWILIYSSPGAKIKLFKSSQKKVFILSRLEYQYREVDLKWKMEVPFLRETEDQYEKIESLFCYPSLVSACKWKMVIHDEYGHLSLRPTYCSSLEEPIQSSSFGIVHRATFDVNFTTE